MSESACIISAMGYEPTPEQIAQAQEKRLRRRAKKLQQENQPKYSPPLFLARPWTQLQPPGQSCSVKVVTWNVRTHIFVHPSATRSQYIIIVARPVSCSCVRIDMHLDNQSRRITGSELFPTSGKARKASERAPMVHAEILFHDADVLCMQVRKA